MNNLTMTSSNYVGSSRTASEKIEGVPGSLPDHLCRIILGRLYQALLNY